MAVCHGPVVIFGEVHIHGTCHDQVALDAFVPNEIGNGCYIRALKVRYLSCCLEPILAGES